MPEVGWPDLAEAAQRTESTRSCCPSSRQRSGSFTVTWGSVSPGIAPGRSGTVLAVKVAVAFDHRGVRLRDAVLDAIADHEIVDLGVDTGAVRVDYPDKAREVGEALASGEAERAVFVCGSGVGASVAACKLPGIRAAVCHYVYSAHQGVEHDDMNVLCLGSDIVGPQLATDLIRTFLLARFDGGERYVRRLEKVATMERGLTNA